MNHSLNDLKGYHEEAVKFFAAELYLMKEVIPQITNDRLAKAATLLMSCGQTGAVLVQIAVQADSFTTQTAMLARAFIEGMTNFCYVGLCDENEFRAFVLHPVYKHYHELGSLTMAESLGADPTLALTNRKAKQEKFKEKQIVKEALHVFSETKATINWTKKRFGERIELIEQSKKLMDVFFTINQLQYYSDASEALHGSLYGSTYTTGIFNPDFDHSNSEKLAARLHEINACTLLHLGMLIHEAFTLISYSDKIEELWDPSYRNRNLALNLLFHLLGIKQNSTQMPDA